MMSERVSLFGWGAFFLSGLATAGLGASWQFAFAALAIGLLGLPHGASDLAVVDPARRPPFVASYLGCIAAVMLMWRENAVVALGMLLALSAGHFASDGAAGRRSWRDIANGAFLVAGPALFHQAAVAGLFEDATGSRRAAALFAALLQPVALVATAMLSWHALTDRSNGRERGLRAIAIAMTLALPPLPGCATGFVLLHARGQTTQRQREIGCETLAAYLVRVAPLMAGAIAVLALIGLATLHHGFGGATFLFAGIAALATPHMLVTPLWRRPASIDRPPGARARAMPVPAMRSNG